ncbi:MAG: hypothetical protein LBQ30_08310 [Treponema sp.]|nr:hypothetical protein [Treponema sp.]
MKQALLAAVAALVLGLGYGFSQEDSGINREMEKNGLLEALTDSSSSSWGTGSPQKPVAGDARTTVAVLDFVNVDGHQSVLGRYFAEQAAHYLVKKPHIRIVERTQINRVLGEMDFSASGYVSDASAIELGGMLGASALIMGTLTKIGRKIAVHMRTIDTRTGVVLNTGTVELSGGKYLQMYQELLNP